MSVHKIYIDDLKIDAIIGILEEERTTPQRLIVNVVIEYHRESDYFINYAHVVELIQERLQNKRYGLLEDAIKDIMLHLKEDYLPIKSIKMKISKPDILENCVVGVELFTQY